MAVTKILVADDEENITDVCVRYLQREGYEVIFAKDGKEALHLWERESPDLIVLDLMMPKKTGWQVCEEIRNSRTDKPIMEKPMAEKNKDAGMAAMTIITIKIGTQTVTINGMEKMTASPAVIFNDKTYVSKDLIDQYLMLQEMMK
ncbi:MAG: PhoP family transcriptional regulator [Paenibacillus sp.]|nr:PhoP family transcriptional regulator [Paenibacillus sp.]